MLLLVLGLAACPRAGPGARGPEVVDVAVAGSTACALAATGSVRCWGARLGASGGDTGVRPVPLLEVRAIGAGPRAMCAATAESLPAQDFLFFQFDREVFYYWHISLLGAMRIRRCIRYFSRRTLVSLYISVGHPGVLSASIFRIPWWRRSWLSRFPAARSQ